MKDMVEVRQLTEQIGQTVERIERITSSCAKPKRHLDIKKVLFVVVLSFFIGLGISLGANYVFHYAEKDKAIAELNVKLESQAHRLDRIDRMLSSVIYSDY